MGTVIYDPKDPECVAATAELLKGKLGSASVPVLVHEEPSLLMRLWLWVSGPQAA